MQSQEGRVTAGELRRWKEAAELRGVPFAAWCRWGVSAHLEGAETLADDLQGPHTAAFSFGCSSSDRRRMRAAARAAGVSLHSFLRRVLSAQAEQILRETGSDTAA